MIVFFGGCLTLDTASVSCGFAAIEMEIHVVVVACLHLSPI